VLVTGCRELDEAPERELGLHDDRPAAVQTPDADGVVAGQLEHGGRVTLLVDAVTRRRHQPVSTSVHLLRVHALHSLLVTHVDTERPSSRQIVIDQLIRIRHITNSLVHLTAPD